MRPWGLCLAAMIAFFAATGCAPPPDQSLIDSFNSRRTEFENMQRTLCALGKYEFIGYDGRRYWSLQQPEKKFFSHDYLPHLGIRSIIVFPAGYKGRAACTVFFDVGSNLGAGAVQPYRVKVIRHGPPENVPVQVKRDLDHIPKDDRRAVYQRHIVDDWWLEARNDLSGRLGAP